MPKRKSTLPGIRPDPHNQAWTLADYDNLLAGICDPEALRQLDRRGMTPTIAAALDSGSLVHRLMALLDEPETDGALSRIEELLKENVEQQRANGIKLDAVLFIMGKLAPRLMSNMGLTTPNEAAGSNVS